MRRRTGSGPFGQEPPCLLLHRRSPPPDPAGCLRQCPDGKPNRRSLSTTQFRRYLEEVCAKTRYGERLAWSRATLRPGAAPCPVENGAESNWTSGGKRSSGLVDSTGCVTSQHVPARSTLRSFWAEVQFAKPPTAKQIHAPETEPLRGHIKNPPGSDAVPTRSQDVPSSPDPLVCPRPCGCSPMRTARRRRFPLAAPGTGRGAAGRPGSRYR
jgi:hypothetical protein